MRNRLTITVSNIQGARQFTLHIAVLRLGLIAALLAFLTLIGSVVLVSWLGKTVAALEIELGSINERKEAVINDYERALQAQNLRVLELSERLQLKNGELDQLQAAYSRLAGEFDLPFEVNEKASGQMLEEVETTLMVRRLMLNRIPSGYPIQDFRFSDGFGWRIHPVSKQRKHHNGQDLAAPSGTPIYAPADGVVVDYGYNNGGYGNYLVISHGYGFTSVYAHLQGSDVDVGQVVFRGQQIARVGNTGVSTGPHLHYEIRFLDQPLNPRPFMEWNERDFNAISKKVKEVPWASLAELVHQETQLMARQSLPVAAVSKVN